MHRSQSLNVHLLPSLAAEEELAGGTVVVVDVLRATTTIVCALAAGAREVRPCREVEQARRLAASLGKAAVLGGERGGKRIDGFDLGNSPDEYAGGAVRGKTIVFTSTNGTRAMERCRPARRVLIGAFVNLSAVCDQLRRPSRSLASASPLHVVCAGTDGEPTREDVLFAGAVADELTRAAELNLNDQAQIARDAWRQVRAEFSCGRPLAEALRNSRGARNLIEIGHERDIEIAAVIDRFDIAPLLDVEAWRITIGNI